jgi:hypothetical protein
MSFWILITDSDNKIFSLHGPLLDDTDWTNKTVDAQRRGRQVRCSTIPANENRVERVKRALARGLTNATSPWANQIRRYPAQPAGSMTLPPGLRL